MLEQKTISEIMNLSGKVAIVTGGAMGIGYAIASRLAEAGAKVLIADNDEGAAKAAESKIPNSKSFVVDVSDEKKVDAMVAKAVAEFGGVDILVNNAGIYPKESLNSSLEDFQKILAINLEGAFLCTKVVAKQMIAQGRGGSPRWGSGAAGKIINITSVDAVHPSGINLSFYDASKHGLWGFTKDVALELAPHKIYVNAIAPGSVETPGTEYRKEHTKEEQEAYLLKIPMRRLADADEIGKVALFLASDLSSYMTGSQITVDGGKLLS
jgi:2-deoxy-D-gluconate 3-dehydrogenase